MRGKAIFKIVPKIGKLPRAFGKKRGGRIARRRAEKLVLPFTPKGVRNAPIAFRRNVKSRKKPTTNSPH